MDKEDSNKAEEKGLAKNPVAVVTSLQKESTFTNLDNLIKAELDMQITTAKAYPRTITTFIRTAVDLATLDTETAESCIYALPRDGKMIEGPSVRLAEIIFSCYGNLRAGAQIIGNDGKKLISRGYCHDLETNVMVDMEVSRRITDKHGRPYSEDMQVVTGNAANAISFRNAIFKVIPMAITKGIIGKVRGVIKGSIKDLSSRRLSALSYFEKLGIKKERVFDAINVKGIEDIGEEEIITLIGFKNALDNHEVSLTDCFPEKKPESVKAKQGEKMVMDGIANMNGKKESSPDMQGGQTGVDEAGSTNIPFPPTDKPTGASSQTGRAKK